MRHTRLLLAVVPLIAEVSSAAAQASPAQDSIAAPRLYSDLGSLTHRIATKSAKAQAYFDQGLRLYYGFNSEEALRAFREAARLDPESPMPQWGVAMALGPNVNFPMDTAAERQAYAAAREATRLAAHGDARDRAWVAALADRYSPVPGMERGKRDTLYAGAMRVLARQYADDKDAAVLLAESLMLLHPWDWFTGDGKPVGSILEAIGEIERVLRVDPNHAGACHFYIHAVEQSLNPARALPCADRLSALMPGAGHIVHMPAHIYMRTGNYAEAVRRNQHAAHADEVFIGEQRPKGVYPFYYAHNLHFLWAAAAMDGQSKVSLKAARDLVAQIPPEIYEQAPLFELIAAVPTLALARFEMWNDVLGEAAPKASLRLARTMWHHARGIAYARSGRPDSALRELAALRVIAAKIPRDQLVMTTNTAPQVTDLAARNVEAEIALARGRTADGIALLRAAVRMEDGLRYDEPATWYVPIRQRLGRVLLAADQPAAAEKAFREDLLRNPENGWSLDGLAKSLKAQRKITASADVMRRFRKAWTRADVTL